MNHTDILVIGGAGFVGRHIVNRLVERGLGVTVPVRRRSRAGHLITLPTIDVVEADLHDDATLDRLISGRDAVINLVDAARARWFSVRADAAPRRAHAGARRSGDAAVDGAFPRSHPCGG